MQERMIDVLELARKYVPDVEVYTDGNVEFASIIIDMAAAVAFVAMRSNKVGSWAVTVHGAGGVCFSVDSKDDAVRLVRVLSTQAEICKAAAYEEIEEIQRRSIEKLSAL